MSTDHHLDTSDFISGVKHRTVSGGLITGAAQAALLSINLTSIVVLARLLTPEDFGIVAMAFTLVAFLQPLGEGGLATATLQREGITHAQVSNLFWANVTLGATIAIVAAISAPAVAWFYGDLRLINITLTLSISFVLTALSVQHIALLKRRMRFTALAVIQVSSSAGGALTGIALAWFGFGYWCLIGIQLTVPLLLVVLVWSFSGWRPQLPARGSSTLSLLHFGAHLTASRVMWSLARGSDSLLIGKVFGTESLGLYSRAAALLNRPLEQALGPMESVFVPALSRLQVEPARYRRVALQILEVVAIAGFLCAALLLAVAHPLTVVMLGSRWEEAAPIFGALTWVALYAPITSVAGWLLSSEARGRDFLLLSSIASVITVLGFLVGIRFGPFGVAASYSFCCLFIHLPVAFHIVGRRGVVTTRDLWNSVITHCPVWAATAGSAWLVKGLASDFSSFLQLCVATGAGLLAGFAFIFVYKPSRRAAFVLLAIALEWKSSPPTTAFVGPLVTTGQPRP